MLLPDRLFCARSDSLFESLRHSYGNSSSSQILAAGNARLKNKDLSAAHILFSIVAARFRPDMSDNEKSAVVEAYLRTGSIYQYQTNFIEALDEYLKGLEICEETESQPFIMELYTRIGLIYCNLEDYDTGLMFLKKGYAIRTTHPDRKAEANLLADLTAYSAFVGNTADAWRYYKLSEKIRPAADSTLNFRLAYNKGLIYNAQENYDEAIKAFHSSEALTGSLRMKCFVYEQLYVSYQGKQNVDSTINYMRLANELSRKVGLNSIYMSTLKALADFYRSKDLPLSLSYKDRYLTIADSCYNSQKFNRLRAKQFAYSIEASSRRISQLELTQYEREKSIRLQRLVMLAIATGFLVSVILLIIVYKKKKKLNDSYKELYLSSQRSLKSEQANQERFKAYEEEIAELRNLTKKNTSGKYSQSGLKDTHKEELRSRIDDLANNSDKMLNPDFSLARMAQLLSSNSQYVSQVLNEVYGKSFNDFLNEYRVKEACRRISDNDIYSKYSMEGIGESVGYKSKSTFFRVFHKITGLSPSVYKKMALKERDK